MPYPTTDPTNKHDLVLCRGRLPSDSDGVSLRERWGFDTTSALFGALEHPLPAPDKVKKLSSVYSYGADAPHPPLSRALSVLGVADVSLSVVRKLLGGSEDHDDQQQQVPDCLHPCSVGVKRGDGPYLARLPPEAAHNSKEFADFVRRLRRENLVAVLAQDKHRRFALLRPSTDDEQHQHHQQEGEYQSYDFYADCFVGNVDEVRAYLTRGLRSATGAAMAMSAELEPHPDQPPTPPYPPPPDDDDHDDGYGGEHEEGEGSMMWQPPGGDATTNGDDAGGGGGGDLWQPPGDEGGGDDSGGGGGMWQPPTGDDDGGGGTNDFGASANPWEAGAASAPQQMEPSNGRKRPRDDDDGGDDNGGGGENEFHADSGAAAADAFYSGLTRTLSTRADSRIFHMRAFNGWVKATQIQELDPKNRGGGGKGGGRKADGPMRVLDLACGKGGDLGKWVLHPRGISNYVGIDVARGSLRDAAIRARAPNMRSKLKRCTFTVADLGSDVPGRLKSPHHKHMQKLQTWSLQNEPSGTTDTPEFRMVRGGGISQEDKFDVVSIQFAIHYMMSSRKRARRFFQTVSELLEVGGNLIATTIDARVVLGHMMNLGLDLHFDDADSGQQPKAEEKPAVVRVGDGACRLTFEPKMVKRIFHAVNNNKEDDVDKDLFGIEYTFALVEGSDHGKGVGDAVNLPEWLTPIPVLQSLGEEAGLQLEYAHNFHEFFKERSDPRTAAAAHSSLYNMKVMNRNGSIAPDEWEISRLYMAIKFRKVRESTMALDESDDEEEEEEEEEEIDPAVKSKLLPMAMMKAKRSVGDDAWKALSSDEKTALTEAELRKLAQQQK